jgi:ABC-2 type transport system permease protein
VKDKVDMMFSQIIAITIKEFKVLLRDKGAFTGLFIIPIAFILVMTVALQGLFNAGSENNPVAVLLVNQDRGQVAAKVIADLREMGGLELVDTSAGHPVTRPEAEDMIAARKYSIALVFPADFSSSIFKAAQDPASTKAMVAFVVDPALGNQVFAPVRGMVEGCIEREASLAQAPLRVDVGFEQLAASAPESQAGLIREIGARYSAVLAASESEPNLNIGVDTQVVVPARYKTIHNLTSAEQNVPGYMIYGVFFIITTISTSLFREKNEGTLRRIQAAPVSRAVFLAGKLLPYFLVNLIQIVLMLCVGVVVFHISLGNHPLALVPISLATAAVATGMGLLIASLGKTQEQVGSLSSVLAIVMSAMGGMMVPVSVMPAFMQKVSLIIPHAWALTGFQDVIVRGQGLVAVLPVAGVLMVYALVFWGVAIWRFRFE